jgi:FixJ family two-component response regulator
MNALVVVVDDDARVRESIESLVESAGYTSLMFASAEDLLRSGAWESATCVIADVRMPGMDGIELQRRIRARHSNMPIIFITAHYEGHARDEAFQGGAADFLYKPFDAAELLNAIGRALRKE